MCTGEASGDMLAAALADAMRARRSGIDFEGIGGERMLGAGFSLAVRNHGWASMGLLAALGRIVPLLVSGLVQLVRLRMRPPDLIVLVDFGAFNLRLAGALRTIGYRGPILYYFPPGVWFDRPSQARKVAARTTALTAFRRQRDFYRSLGLPIAYFGHPLVSMIAPREPRLPPAVTAGSVALLPGSRVDEVRHTLPRLLAACALLKKSRPDLDVVVSIANAEVESLVREALPSANVPVRTVQGARAALDAADAALIVSGTAVLEAALRDVPCAALYVVSASGARYGRRIWRRPFFTLPNLLLEREVVPEFWQERATPEALAAAAEALLRDPSAQHESFREMRVTLDGAAALEGAAEFAVALASGEHVA
jgi:lipid-A-disaccharide synthase